MGNCCERCFGRLDKRRYLRTRYNVERDISIEFENLMDEETQENDLPNGKPSLVTEKERLLLSSRQYDTIVQEQKLIDAEINRQLVHQEEELRREEEAYYQAKREASRVAKVLRRKEQQVAKLASSSRKDANTWLGEDDSDWEIAGGEDDFDMFLECVKARSLAAQTRAISAQAPIDVASETSSKDDRSKTEASSIDLEWEHEAGMQPVPKEKRKKFADGNIAELAVKPMLLPSDKLSDDFEWDNDFDSSPNRSENRTLLAKSPPPAVVTATIER